MKIALKYCGGCNPVYERENIAKWLKKDFENIDNINKTFLFKIKTFIKSPIVNI